MAAFPPADVTAATMLSGSDRAPDSTATVPRGNAPGSTSGQRFGDRQQDSDSGNRSSARATTCPDRPSRTPQPSADEAIPAAQRGLLALIGGESRSHNLASWPLLLTIFECMFDTIE